MKNKEEFITEEKVINTPAGGVLIGKDKNGQTIIPNDGSLGGFLIGRLHKDGGIKAINKGTGQPLEMQSNEIVITAPAVSDQTKHNFNGKMMTNREILSKINSDGGGVSFADGGDIPAKIHTIDKEYEYGGKMVHDSDIAQSLGMNSTLKKGKQHFSSGGKTYDVDAIYNAIKKGKLKVKTKEVPTFAMKYPVYDKKYSETVKTDFRKPNGITVLTESDEEVLIDGNYRMNNAYLKGRKTMKTYYIENPKQIAKFTKKNKFELGGQNNDFKYAKPFGEITIFTNVEQEYVGNNYSPFENKGSFKATIRKGDLENIALESKDLANFNFEWGVDNWNTISKKLKQKNINKLELYSVGKQVKTFELRPLVNNEKQKGNYEFKNGGHLSKNKSLKQIAEMHNVSLAHINQELAKGLEVEKEHFNDFKERTRVAKDHLVENPNYYTILEKVGLKRGGAIEKQDLVKDAKSGDTPARDLNNYNDLLDVETDGEVGGDSGIYADGGGVGLPKVAYVLVSNAGSSLSSLLRSRYNSYKEFKESVEEAYKPLLNRKPILRSFVELEAYDENNTKLLSASTYISNQKNTIRNFNPITGNYRNLEKSLAKSRQGSFQKFDWEDWFLSKVKPSSSSMQTPTSSNFPEYYEFTQEVTSGFTKGKIYKIKNPSQIGASGNFIDDEGMVNGYGSSNSSYFKPSTEQAFLAQQGINSGSNKPFDFTDTKINVKNNPALSQKVQKKAFESGWEWEDGAGKTIDYSVINYLYFTKKSISDGFTPSSFINSPKREITEAEIFGSQNPNAQTSSEKDVQSVLITYSGGQTLTALNEESLLAKIVMLWKNNGNSTMSINLQPQGFVMQLSKPVTVILDNFTNTLSNTIKPTGISINVLKELLSDNWFPELDWFLFFKEAQTPTSSSAQPFDLSKTRIKVGADRNLSKKIQEKAFELGWGWGSGIVKDVQSTGADSLFFDDGKQIEAYYSDVSFREAVDYREITVDELFGTPKTTSKPVVPKTIDDKKFTDFKEAVSALEGFASQASKKYNTPDYEDSLQLFKEVKEEYSLALSFTPESSFMYERIELMKKINEVQKEITRITELKNGGAYYILAKVIDRLEKGENWKDLGVGEIMINEVPEQEIEFVIYTEKFKNWFGNWEEALITKEYDYVSKALTANGKPTVMFHGAKRIKYSYRQVSNGVLYLAENRSYAEWFSANESPYQKQGDYLTQCFVNLKNPIDLTVFGVEEVDLRDIIQFIDTVYPLAKIYDVLPPNTAMAIMNNQLIGRNFRAWYIIRQFPELNKHIRDNTDYDGFIYYENNPSDMITSEITGQLQENVTKATAVFNSNQVKLVDAMLFDASLDDWRFEQGGKVNQ